MNKKFLFYDQIFAKLYINEGGSILINTGWGYTDLVAYKGVSTSIEFMIINHDRKPLFLRGRKVFIKILDFYSQDLLLEKELIVVDPLNGRVKLILTPGDIDEWEDGNKKFMVTVLNEDENLEFPLYNDFSQGITGNILIKSSYTPAKPSPQKLLGFTTVENNNETIYVSNTFKGPIQLGYSSSLITVSFYFENFSGKLYTQASVHPVLNNVDSNIWFNIQLVPGFDYLKLNNETGIQAYNIFGNYNYVKFYYVPDYSNKGSISNILVL